MSTVVVLLRIILAGVFLTAGVGKLFDLAGSRQAMRDFGVPDRLADAAGLLLPLAELAVAVGLLFRPTAQWAAVGAFVLVAAFIGGIANALRHGIAPDCHCFGQIHSEPAGPSTLIRNGVLAALSLFVAIAGPRVALDTWIGARSAAELVAIGLALVLGVLAVLYLQLRTEVLQLRADVGMAQRMAASAPPGVPVGSHAPAFELESLEGEVVALHELHEHTPVLLIFVSPWCGSCSELFPNIRRWQQTLQERLQIALITSGTLKDNEPLGEEHGLRNVLVQKDREMIEAYRIRGTPTAMLVNPDGRMASAPAESVFAIEPLVRVVLRDGVAAVPQDSVA